MKPNYMWEDEANARLAEMVCLYKDIPAYVKRVHLRDNLASVILYEDNHVCKELQVPFDELDVSPIPYGLFMDRTDWTKKCQVLYLDRLPLRQYRQGTDVRHMTINDFFIVCQYLIHNKYPDYDFLKAQYHQKKIVGAHAFDRLFSVQLGEKTGLPHLFYKNKGNVGHIDFEKDRMVLNAKNQHLKTILEEKGYACQ